MKKRVGPDLRDQVHLSAEAGPGEDRGKLGIGRVDADADLGCGLGQGFTLGENASKASLGRAQTIAGRHHVFRFTVLSGRVVKQDGRRRMAVAPSLIVVLERRDQDW